MENVNIKLRRNWNIK